MNLIYLDSNRANRFLKRTFFHPGATKCEEQKREAREDYGKFSFHISSPLQLTLFFLQRNDANHHFPSSVIQVHDVSVRIFIFGKNWIITKSAMDMVHKTPSEMMATMDTKTTIGIDTILMIEIIIINIVVHRLSSRYRMIQMRKIITRTTTISIVYSSSVLFFFLICSINPLVIVMKKKMNLLNCCSREEHS